MEEAKKRKAEEELEHYRQKVRAKQQNETKSLEDFRWGSEAPSRFTIPPSKIQVFHCFYM